MVKKVIVIDATIFTLMKKELPFGRNAGEFTEWEDVGRESDLIVL